MKAQISNPKQKARSIYNCGPHFQVGMAEKGIVRSPARNPFFSPPLNTSLLLPRYPSMPRWTVVFTPFSTFHLKLIANSGTPSPEFHLLLPKKRKPSDSVESRNVTSLVALTDTFKIAAFTFNSIG